MVYCAVAGCNSNNNKKSKNMSCSYRYFTFPTSNKEICKLWVQKCYQKSDFNVKYGRICSKHFSDDDYRIKEKLLKLPKTKWVLNDDAVPSLHLAKLSKTKTPMQEDREKRKIKRDLIRNMKNL